MDFCAIVLAGGRGKRMRDESSPTEFPKVLRQVMGRPLISYVLEALRAAGIDDIGIIVGFGADHVRKALGAGFDYVLQPEQLGSGHAVACARDAFGNRGGHVVIMCGDSPLFGAAAISSLMERHASSGATITLVSTEMDDPTGYGRILRGPSGEIAGVVEEKCASPEEKLIGEVNGGAYAFDSKWLWENIDRMRRNEAGEFNLTDLVREAVSQGRPVLSVDVNPEEIMGANTPEDLRRIEDVLRLRHDLD